MKPGKNKQEKTEKKKKRQKNGSWVWSVIMAIFALTAFSTNGCLSGLLFLAAAAALNPIIYKKSLASGKIPNRKYYVVGIWVIIFGAFLAVPRTDQPSTTEPETVAVMADGQTYASNDTTEFEDPETEKSLGQQEDTEQTEKETKAAATSQKTDRISTTVEKVETATETEKETKKETAAQTTPEATIPETTVLTTVAETEPTTAKTTGTIQVYYLDMGQSDCTVVISDDGSCLVFDAGDNAQGTKIQLFLQNHGVSKIDTLIVSHFDADHCGGADVLITKYDIGRVIYPSQTKDTATCRDVLDAMSYKGYKVTAPVVGTTYSLGGASYTIIAPSRDNYSDVNDSSVGIILTYGNNRFLFTGDAEEEGEADILKTGINIDCDVFQAGHHGSRTSSSAALLDAATPEYVVISCGEGNSYGHPHAETLNNLRQRGIKVYRTDEQGTIACTSDGTTITFDGSPSISWQAGEPTENSQTQAPTTAAPTTAAPTTVTPTTAAPTTAAPTTAAPAVVETQPAGTDYICNTNTKKFHYTGCASVARMSEKNKLYFTGSRDDLIQQGYSPCGNCNP